jgi:hypothetical protein
MQVNQVDVGSVIPVVVERLVSAHAIIMSTKGRASQDTRARRYQRVADCVATTRCEDERGGGGRERKVEDNRVRKASFIASWLRSAFLT